MRRSSTPVARMTSSASALGEQPEEEAERSGRAGTRARGRGSGRAPSRGPRAPPRRVASTIGDQALAPCGSSGCGWLTSQKPASAGRRNQAKPRPRPLAEHERRADDGDERLDLLDHDRRDEVAVEERLGEEDRRDRRRAGADATAARDVPRARAPQTRAQRGQRAAAACRARGSRARRRRSSSPTSSSAQRLADDRVGAPHRRGDCDEHDSRDVRGDSSASMTRFEA